jgi:hypothetical protein
MATHSQLLNTLKAGSYLHGWGAIAAFDSATIAPMLADYYGSMIHGPKASLPIAKEQEEIFFTQSRDLYATIQNFVVAAPKFSLGAGSLQNPKVLLTYELSRGMYSERSVVPGKPEQVAHLINIAAGRRHTLTVELNLADATGHIDDQGTTWLTLGAASNPLCSLGSSDLAQREVGKRLWELFSSRQIGPRTLALGSLMPERTFLRPGSFILRPQAGPAGTGGALLAFIAKPQGTPGDIPSQEYFPYLLPDDRDSAGKAYSATLLVSRDYAKLRKGEAEQLFGQILFPNEQYFQLSSEHLDTQDIALFGAITRGAQTPVRKVLRNVPGTMTQLLTLSASASAPPVSLKASSSTMAGWRWELPHPGLGTLTSLSGADAVYTPPDSLPDASVLLQRVVATNSGTGERYEVCLVLQGSSDPVVAFESALTSEMPFSTPIPLTHGADVEGYSEEWLVVGQGTVVETGPNRCRYTSPPAGGDDVELVVCRIWQELHDGTLKLRGYGYTIIYMNESQPVRQWSNLEPFKLRAKHVAAVPYANGMQQFEIEVEIGTGTGEPDITDAEFATLRLGVRGGADIPLIPHTLEGLVPDADGVNAQWAYKMERNRFQLASNTVSQAPKKRPRGSTRWQTFYLHTVAESPSTFVVRITDATNKLHESSTTGEGEGQERSLTVNRRVPEVWNQNLSRIPIMRVAGNSDSPDDPNYGPDNPNYDWHLRTCDYWTLAQQINEQPVRIVRLQIHSDGPSIKWESEQNNEDLFSYMGYALITGPSAPQALEFASVVYDPVLYLPKVFEGEPQHALIKHASAPSPGQVLLSVNRVLDVFYRQRQVIKDAAGDEFSFENSCRFSLWDEYGNEYNLEVSFEQSNRNKLYARVI